MANETKKFLAIRISPQLLSEVDAVVPERGRTKFIEEAMREKLQRLPEEKWAKSAAQIAAQVGEVKTSTPVRQRQPRVNFTIPNEDSGAGHTMSPDTCAHIALGAPQENADGLVYRVCRGCGSPIFE